MGRYVIQSDGIFLTVSAYGNILWTRDVFDAATYVTSNAAMFDLQYTIARYPSARIRKIKYVLEDVND